MKADVPTEIGVEKFALHDPKPEALLHFLREMEFNTLTKRIAEGLGVEAPPPLEKSVGASLTKPSPLVGEGAGGRNHKRSVTEAPDHWLLHKAQGEARQAPHTPPSRIAPPRQRRSLSSAALMRL